MPEISRFLGIIIKMFYNEHAPPHFHAEYNDHKAEILIETLEIKEGKLPRRVYSLVLEWATEHRDELIADWNLAREKKILNKIDPLV
ncbi:MAG: DUF4160 domain-containing protein [Ignavibacteria bacterium]|nr:DUF4160 domain-containing protein [Ignavibacteria bacterium]